MINQAHCIGVGKVIGTSGRSRSAQQKEATFTGRETSGKQGHLERAVISESVVIAFVRSMPGLWCGGH